MNHLNQELRTLPYSKWKAEIKIEVDTSRFNFLRIELYDRRRRGESIFMGQVELAGTGFVDLQVPSNGVCRDFELRQSSFLHVQRVKHLQGMLTLASPDSDTFNFSGTVDQRLRCIHQVRTHEGRVECAGTHYDTLMRESSWQLPILGPQSCRLTWPPGFAAKKPARGQLTFRLEEEPVVIAAYIVLRRTVCREKFDVTSRTTSTLDPGQIITVSEQRTLGPDGNLRVKSVFGWANQHTPSGIQCLELLNKNDPRYQKHILELDQDDEEAAKSCTYIVRVTTGDVKHAGTDANVFVRIYGKDADSGIRKLKAKAKLKNLFEVCNPLVRDSTP